LAAIIAVASGFREKPVSAGDVIFGEVGLGGETRAVSNPEIRIKEAKKLGFKRVILPQSNLKNLNIKNKKNEIELVGVSSVKEVLDIMFG